MLLPKYTSRGLTKMSTFQQNLRAPHTPTWLWCDRHHLRHPPALVPRCQRLLRLMPQEKVLLFYLWINYIKIIQYVQNIHSYPLLHLRGYFHVHIFTQQSIKIRQIIILQCNTNLSNDMTASLTFCTFFNPHHFPHFFLRL